MIATNYPTLLKSTIRLHPNPVTDYVQINGLTGTALLVISDLNCIPMLKKHLTADEQIPMDRLKKGVYIAKITTPTETIERKLVKI